MEPWVAIPDGIPAPKRTRLTAARLIADGIWFETVTSQQLSENDRGRHDDVRAFAHSLIEESQ